MLSSCQKNVPAVIFDLDGTLLDTLKDLADCHNRMLVSQGYPPHPVEAYKYFIGNGARKCVERVLPEKARTEEIIDLSLELQAKEYASNWHVATREYPGISSVLEKLVAGKTKIAVLSNKNQQFTQLCIRHFFPNIHFNVIQGHVPGIPHKPDPMGALGIAESLGVARKDIILLGDSGIDMATATAAGMRGIGALWGFRTGEELKAAGAAVLLETPAQLLEHTGTRL
jgi:phosphoglycolate phosphatase